MIFSLAFFFLHVFLYFYIFDTGLLFSPSLLIARTNPGSFVRKRWNGTASPRRPGYEEMWARSLLPPSSGISRDAKEIQGMFEDLSARVKQDEEGAARV